MKILVDEMPQNPSDCPYSELRGNLRGDIWTGCTKGTFVCQDTKKCKFFKAITDYEVDIYGCPVHGIIVDK